ncbi:MAG: hypothetical protein LBD02_00780 [Christensenellaceae bacterium]|jgi:hypothetical protein|nr:hypothetical protein [Christensenellaceae bacterium]
MTNPELTERYIYAATRRLPPKMRTDLEKELRGLIADMLEERCGEVTPTEHDLRVVLTELGSPGEFARKSLGDRPQALLGGEVYPSYVLVLKIVIAATAFGLTLAMVLSFVTDGAATHPLVAALEWLSSLFFGEMLAFGFVTLIFVLFERRGVKFQMGEEGLDSLPPVPKSRERIPPWEPICGIAFCLGFLFVFLVCPQIIGGYFSRDFVWTPIFEAAAIRRGWPILLAFAALGICREIIKLLEGRYSRRVALVSLGADLLSLPLALGFFWNPALINPIFVGQIHALLADVGELMLFGRMHHFMGCVVLFALVLDAATSLFRAFRAGREQGEV